MANKLLVVIGGPTGIGKTELAIRLALHYKTEIVSADSRQIYRELSIGVGRPSDEQLQQVRHHMIGSISIHQEYTVADFATQALEHINDLFKTQDIVLLTGGTGLYIRAITEGLDDIPPVPRDITLKWQNWWNMHGTDALAMELQERDPDYYAVVDRANARRIVRALTVCEATGKPYSSFLHGGKQSRPFESIAFALELPREQLYARVDQRVMQMITDGWEAEARMLYPFRQLKALDTVGYKEWFAYFDGNLSYQETIDKIQQSTRRYAKRQITWFRHQGDWLMTPPDQDKMIIAEIDRKRSTLI